MRRILGMLGTGLLFASPAIANDTMAELKTGGLDYIRSGEVSMDDESLFISPTEVRVDYVFKNATVKVQHRYKPSVGGTVAITFLQDGQPNGDYYKQYVQKYCIDDSFVKTAQKLEKAAASGGTNYTESWISYVLTTGANWYGPIGHFKLTVDKGDAQNYVSFCGTGVKKTGPTTFEMTATDFSPQKDLDILILNGAKPE